MYKGEKYVVTIEEILKALKIPTGRVCQITCGCQKLELLNIDSTSVDTDGVTEYWDVDGNQLFPDFVDWSDQDVTIVTWCREK